VPTLTGRLPVVDPTHTSRAIPQAEAPTTIATHVGARSAGRGGTQYRTLLSCIVRTDFCDDTPNQVRATRCVGICQGLIKTECEMAADYDGDGSFASHWSMDEEVSLQWRTPAGAAVV
jgi:hypothetical protein